MSNFDFLKGFDDTLWKWGNRIEDEINTPSAVKADSTPFLEHLLKKLRQRYGLGNSTKDFYHLYNCIKDSFILLKNIIGIVMNMITIREFPHIIRLNWI